MWGILTRARRCWYAWPTVRRARVADALAVTAWGLVPAVFGERELAQWLVVAAGLLAGRRRWPLSTLSAVGALDLVVSWTASEADLLAPFAIGGAAYAAGRWARLPRSVPPFAAISAGFAVLYPVDFEIWLALCALVIWLPGLFGLYVRRSHQLIDAVRREQDAAAERAAMRERERLTGEVHDLLGNRLSLIVLNAGALEVSAAHADRAAMIRRAGREALRDLRRVVLGDSTASPVADLGSVEELFERSREAGLPLETRIHLPPTDRLSAGTSRTAYAVVRETLTNIHKHGGITPTEVRIFADDGQLVVEVRNRVPATSPDTYGVGSGRGLAGLSAMVAALAGSFEFGAGPSEYAVRARLPLPGPRTSEPIR